MITADQFSQARNIARNIARTIIETIYHNKCELDFKVNVLKEFFPKTDPSDYEIDFISMSGHTFVFKIVLDNGTKEDIYLDADSVFMWYTDICKRVNLEK